MWILIWIAANILNFQTGMVLTRSDSGLNVLSQGSPDENQTSPGRKIFDKFRTGTKIVQKLDQLEVRLKNRNLKNPYSNSFLIPVWIQSDPGPKLSSLI